MPTLPNSRHEVFAQELAKGSYATDAYETAGFKRHEGNASTLAHRPDIEARVEEIRSKIAEKVIQRTGIDRAKILEELATLATVSHGDDWVRASDKRAALVDYARIEGWVIERTETGKPGDFDRMDDDELRSFIASREDRVGESHSRIGKANGQTGVRGKSSGIH